MVQISQGFEETTFEILPGELVAEEILHGQYLWPALTRMPCLKSLGMMSAQSSQ
ncbi:hypothetical protein G0Q06_04640 [Puniceicoccales bacterium CK1056]|uniref:Uncharacterized protein n=1 Tax=Oceanipulchritudo coccoides TaxID=2706888 RepID=A0A6B2M1X4_9BACT|nr:hypothetical protein [Oceanipulchritudo coccoides]NDV61730.1 hypothetical protein [Oceanipulchritudo coccoides]